MSKQDKKTFFLWMDLETTGLDHETGEILEVAAVLTDMQLNELDRLSCVISHRRKDNIGKMNDFVLTTHLNSGLLAKVWESSTTLRDAELMVRDMLERHDAIKGQALVYLSGSSIHFDRRWINYQMSTIVLEHLHYRMVDVSIYKTCFPGLLTQPEAGPAHRAMDDILYSIDQQRQMNEFVRQAQEIGLPVPLDDEPTEDNFVDDEDNLVDVPE